MRSRHFFVSAALVCAGITSAHAVALPANGQWLPFDVAFDLSGNLNWLNINDGSALSFSFNVPAGQVGKLTVVDGGFAGDRFAVTANPGVALGTTSAAVNSYPSNVYLDFDAAMANPSYSRNVFTLTPGTYNISGSLLSSALDDSGTALNTTVGGIQLTLAAVPEPSTALSFFVGLVALVAGLRRRFI